MRSIFLSIVSCFSMMMVVSSISAEVPPAAELPCFPGAYYRKAVSSADQWTGIGGRITLPTPVMDPDRTSTTTGKFLDNSSIYLGGNVGEAQEIDAGILWEIIREADGTVSPRRKAYRVFWRNASWHNAPAVAEYYYYPGDLIEMSCQTTEAGKLVLQVDLLARAGEEPGAEPVSSFTTTFDAFAFGPDKVQQFKRVNAIDQTGNEGNEVQPTKAKVFNAIWHEVWLYRGEEKVPFTPERFTDMRCPKPDHFQVTSFHTDKGGEKITILGTSIPASGAKTF
jgi:hypothetical protein